jgi:hypothetical protein
MSDREIQSRLHVILLCIILYIGTRLPTTRRYNPQDSNVSTRCYENFKPCVLFLSENNLEKLTSFRTVLL